MHVEGFLRQPTVERLPNLLQELKSGALRIPPFQRDFVWTGEQRVHVLDSVRKGLPIGSLMVWRTTKHKLASDDPIGPFHLSASARELVPPFQYLLDGRQRMTTLFAALAGGLWSREGEKPTKAESNAPDGTSWFACYDLDSEQFELGDGDGKRPLLPLALVLDDFEMDEWLQAHAKGREHYNRARTLKSWFVDYSIPVVPLVTNELTFVTLSFKRVNSGGTPMSDVHMARALAWSEDFDLIQGIDEIRETLRPEGWGEVEPDTVLKVVAAACNEDPTEYDIERLSDELRRNSDHMAEAGKQLGRAVGVLNGIGFCGPKTLPYEAALTFVARAFAQPEEPDHATLRAWVAEVCITEAFGNAPPHVQRAMWQSLALRLAKKKTKPKKRRARPGRRFSMAWARSRVTAVVLASQRPRDAAGDVIEGAQRMLAEQGTAAIPMLLARSAPGLPRGFVPASPAKELETLLLGSANRVVCHPSDVARLRSAILADDASEALLESHLISSEAVRQLREGDLQGFLETRAQSIIAAEKAWLQELGAAVSWETPA